MCSPVDSQADQNEAWEEKSENPEEGHYSAEQIASSPRYRSVPCNLERH